MFRENYTLTCEGNGRISFLRYFSFKKFIFEFKFIGYFRLIISKSENNKFLQGEN